MVLRSTKNHDALVRSCGDSGLLGSSGPGARVLSSVRESSVSVWATLVGSHPQRIPHQIDATALSPTGAAFAVRRSGWDVDGALGARRWKYRGSGQQET